MKNLINNREDIADFAPKMIQIHLRQATEWAQQWSDLGSRPEREYVYKMFRNECEQALYKLKSKTK